MSEFDPYYRWLGIGPEEQPPTHYRLLGLRQFEADPDVIEGAADRQMTHLRAKQSGQYAELSQQLLNEIAAAKLCLLDDDKKAAYDAKLKAEQQDKDTPEVLPVAQPLPPEASSSTKLPADAPPKKPPGKPSPAPAGRSQSAVGLPPAHSPTAHSPTAQGRPASDGSAVLLVVGLLGIGGVALLLAIAGGFWLLLSSDTTSTASVNPLPVLDNQPAPNELPDNASNTPTHHATKNNVKNTNNPPPLPGVPFADDPTSDEPTPDEPQSHGLVVKLSADEDPVVHDGHAPPGDVANTDSEIDDTASAPPEPQDTRLEMPSDEVQQSKQQEIKEFFELSLANTISEKHDLASRLLKTARGTKDEPAAQFVLFDLAREKACESGDAKLAFEAVDELSLRFKVDDVAMRIHCIQTAVKAPMPSTARKAVLNEGVALVDQLFYDDKYLEAAAAIKLLLDAAYNVRSREHIAGLSDRREQGSTLYREFQKVQDALKALAKDPDDAAANLTVGRYHCFVKGNWQRGLPMMAKGNDQELKQAAEKEIARPESALQQLVVADAWWDLAEKTPVPMKERQQARAGMWYKRMLAELSGLTKVKVQKRLDQIASLEVDGGQPYRHPNSAIASAVPTYQGDRFPPSAIRSTDGKIDLLALVDLSKDRIRGRWSIEDGKIVAPKEYWARLQVPFLPPAEYDVEALISGTEPGFDFWLQLPLAGSPVAVILEGFDDQQTSGIETIDGRRANENETARRGRFFRTDRPNQVTIAVREKSIQVQCNGKTIVSFSGDTRRLSKPRFGPPLPEPGTLYLGTYGRTWTVDSLLLKPIQGEGKPLRDAPVGEAVVQGEIDLIEKIDLTNDAASRGWTREGDTLVSATLPFSHVQIPVRPGEEYKIEVEATRVEGTDDFCIGMVYQGHQCHVALDRHRGSFTDLMVDMRTNADGVARWKGNGFPQGRRRVVTCEVHKDHLRVLLDGNEILTYRGRPHWTGMNDFWRVPDKQALMIGAHKSLFHIHSIKLKPLIDRQPTTAPAEPGAAIDLLALVDPDKDFLQGEWKQTGKSLASPARGTAHARVRYVPPAEYDIEAELAFATENVDFQLKLPNAQHLFTLDLDSSTPIKIGQIQRLKCEVRRTGIDIYQGDKRVAQWKRDLSKTPLRLPNSKPFYLLTSDSVAVLHSLRLVPRGSGGRPPGDRDESPIARPDPPIARPDPPIARPDPPKDGGIDLISRLNLEKDVQRGRFELIRGVLLMRARDTLLQIPYEPPEEYQFELEFRRVDYRNKDYELVVNLPIDGKPCTIVLDRGMEKGRSSMTIETGGVHREHNSPGEVFGMHKTGKLTCVVRKELIQIRCNGRDVFRIDGPRGPAAWDGKWLPPNKTALAIGSPGSIALISSMTLTPITGKPKPVRPDVDKTNGSTPMDDDLVVYATNGNRHKLEYRIDPQRDAANGEWAVADRKVVISPATENACLNIPWGVGGNYTLTLTVSRPEGGKGAVRIALPGHGLVVLDDGEGNTRSGLELLDGKSFHANETSVRTDEPLIQPGKQTQITCICRQGGVRVLCDDREVIKWRGDLRRLKLPADWKGKSFAIGTSGCVTHFHTIHLDSILH